MWNPSLIDGPVAFAGDTRHHLNLPDELVTAALEPYRVEPASPQRVISGVITAFLRFTDEAEARAQPDLALYWIDPPDEDPS